MEKERERLTGLKPSNPDPNLDPEIPCQSYHQSTRNFLKDLLNFTRSNEY